MNVSEIIIKKIKNEGPISFYDFMETALYYPSLGYYTCNKKRIGADGDYYTSPCLSPVFGKLLGKQLEEMWIALGKKKFTIVEIGGNDGLLCKQIFDYVSINPEMYACIEYYIVDKNLTQNFFSHEKVKFIRSIKERKPFSGCILSNELFDNLSVHKVIQQKDLMEVLVDYTSDFVEFSIPASDKIKNYLEELNVKFPEKFCAEINLDAIEMLKEFAKVLNEGFVITMDYGFMSNELYCSKRSEGTITCYHQHKMNFNPYINIGEQDITTHINFSALSYFGKKFGLETTGFTSQNLFLRALGFCEFLRKMETENQVQENEFALLNLLNSLGNKIKILIQQKSKESVMLSGLAFAEQL